VNIAENRYGIEWKEIKYHNYPKVYPIKIQEAQWALMCSPDNILNTIRK